MNLTSQQFQVLADVVESPTDWVKNAIDTLGPEAGEQAVLDKVEKHKGRYKARAMQYGAEYLNRAERIEREKQRLKQAEDAKVAESQAKADAERTALRELIREVVLEVLAEGSKQ